MKASIDNDTFIQKNLTSLVKRFPRQMIVICNGEIFTDKDAVPQARKKFPKSVPLLFPVPAPEEFNHLL